MEPAVYRVLITVFLYTGAAYSAPQDTSTISYAQPLPEATEEVQPQPPRESRIENLPLLIGSSDEAREDEETSDSQRDVSTPSIRSTSEEPTTTVPAEVTELAEVVEPTEPNEVKPRFPAPRFVSKLSYFNKANDFGSGITNLVERTGKRKFRSRCRCEKIWNCPKLQITVPRCPDEYFLCCF